MPERSSKRKARRDSLTSSLGEPEASSQRTENIPSISDRDFSEISEEIERSISGRRKDTETGQRDILEMIENLSSKIDSLPGQTSSTVDLDANENRPESLIPTSRPIEVNELIRGEGQHSYKQSCLHSNPESQLFSKLQKFSKSGEIGKGSWKRMPTIQSHQEVHKFALQM